MHWGVEREVAHFTIATRQARPTHPVYNELSGEFEDSRWVNGTWNLDAFKSEEGKVDWDAVIDAEILRRKSLEDRPASTKNDEPVTFMLSQVRQARVEPEFPVIGLLVRGYSTHLKSPQL